MTLPECGFQVSWRTILDLAMRIGIVYAAVSFSLWGLFPLYFWMLRDVSAGEIVLHRMVWSLAFVLIALTALRRWHWLGQALRDWRTLARFALSAIALTGNWLVYIWACNHQHLLDASLGYFINPLVNVLLGYLALAERLRRLQWVAIALAGAGVASLAWHAGHLPWIGLFLAASFGAYGLLRKTARLGALEGLTLETLLLFPFACAALVWLGTNGQSAFVGTPGGTRFLLIALGPITAVPLLLFAAGARRIPLSLLGILQYICPTLQMWIGVWLFGEPLGGSRLAGFAIIWVALAVYSAEGLWQSGRRASRLAPGHRVATSRSQA